MTFTYSVPFAADRDRVRFAIGDTDSSAPKLTDEEIDAMIDEEGSWQKATLACIDSLLARLSQPDFRADWLQVEHSKARAGLESLRKTLKAKYGLGLRGTGGAVHTYRADSGQTEEPDYSDGRP